MKLLALDTAGAAQSVAVLDGERIVAFGGLAGQRGGSDRILGLVAATLEEARTDVASFDAVSVTRGPGSMTGLRVGIGTARGIAAAAGKPLIGVSSLQALAAGMGAGPPVLVLLDAGRDEVYGNLFRAGDPPRAAGEERVGPPLWFADAVAGREVRIAGSGAARYHALFPGARWIAGAPGEEFLAAGVARVAAAALRAFTREPAGADPSADAGADSDATRRTDDAEAASGPSGSSPGWDATPRYLLRHPPPIRYEV